MIITLYYRKKETGARQQPTLLANLGRTVTVARFSVETAIHHVKSRYAAAAKIPWWVCHMSGYYLNYIAAVHTKFGIGGFKYVIICYNLT